MEDIHERTPSFSIPLELVGVKGVKMPVACVKFNGRSHYTLPTFDAYINLPSTMKGIHASRHYEVIAETISQFAMKVGKLEDICESIAVKLLEKHEYASRSYVRARGSIVFESRIERSDTASFEPCIIIGKAWALRGKLNGRIESIKAVGASVEGMTACPCALEYVRERVKMATSRPSNNELPLATHMQRVIGTIIIEVPRGVDMDVMRLVRIIQDSMSSPTYGLLKRSDEVEVICRAVYNPKFAEDVVRSMARGLIEEFKEYPDSAFFTCYVRSKESIHKHDLVAKHRGTIGELRAYLESSG
ncbi:MAG: GTP cyclohydrolase MptA [Candidatus Nezhaarchaeota archaeon]|nr:GTP cyclohydrolase MptA [Candidatus Nezhaarchaeota archaeon]MCX8141231.1 GTP cyclohydrolase MptA [Candidatus Nezhaarchaeota archaeon]MDW8049497.1 GTP cyclohydrolase MptA [Nitrososphaerota archaeon]